MNRRIFSKKLALGLATVGTLASCRLEAQEKPLINSEDLIKPKRLRAGAKVGLITPGSFIPDEALKKAIANVKKLGYKVVLGKNIRALRGFTAGTDAQRLEDLHAMFADPEIDAIWCARGGYGCTRLLPMIDYDLIRSNPKVLIGYSDITALHNAILQRSDLVTFHGPVTSSTMTAYTTQQFKAVLETPGRHQIKLSKANQEKKDELYQAKTIRGGKARGALIGGNLSLLAAMAGTAYELDFRDKLVFMEDIEEKPYRVDRMLTQLRQSGRLGEAAGFAMGTFAGCEPEPDDRSLSLLETLEDRLLGLRKPCAYGLSWGHISNQATLPVGIQAELDADQHTLTLLEAGVS